MVLIAVGKLRPGPERDLFERYQARLRPALSVREVPDGVGASAEIIRRQGEALLAAAAPSAWAVALDPGGQAPDSVGLARSLERWRGTSRPVTFIIGGADGLSGQVLSRADALLSLGRLTWPHMLVRAMLAEQLYRAQSILAGHPYHRAGPPSR